eukprot:CAMPEP_0173428136 /NCGR_PEP_ID=MMETSP1357-20121228/7159_1 /TAXON_ID=77926 /ORGANISM="Hemiselmis rufescens, Strain PCC563" /LENGTH=169 /DNA_ID=CAMNT_0014392099 /DNA_START=201 /DNA_END=710 /DNA_ORIENTATION=-
MCQVKEEPEEEATEEDCAEAARPLLEGSGSVDDRSKGLSGYDAHRGPPWPPEKSLLIFCCTDRLRRLTVSSSVIRTLGDILRSPLATSTSSSNSLLSSTATMSAVLVFSVDATALLTPLAMLLTMLRSAISPKQCPFVSISRCSPAMHAAQVPSQTKYMVPPGSPLRVT